MASQGGRYVVQDRYKSDGYTHVYRKIQSHMRPRNLAQHPWIYNNVCNLETVKSFEIISGIFLPLDVYRDSASLISDSRATLCIR